MCRWLLFRTLPHLTFCFWHTEFRFKFFGKNSLTRELSIKVVGFVLKKILTYFEMLIVSHALHCVDSCIFVFTSFDSVCHTVKVTVPPPPPPQIVAFLYLPHLTQSAILFRLQCPPPPPPHFIRFSFFVKIHLLESSQLEL